MQAGDFRLTTLDSVGAGAEAFGCGRVVGALENDGVEQEGVAKLNARVGGAVYFLLVFGLVLQQGGQRLFGHLAVGC